MVGTVTNLGMTSDIDMQGMLDQLREIDERVINRKEKKITQAQERISELNTVSQKLLAMKNNALNLSLESTYLDRSITSSDEDVLTASVTTGTSAKSASVDVSQLALKSSWLSSGVAASDTSVYVPTSQESTSGVADPATDIVARNGESITITFGGSSSFTVNIGGDTTMNELVNQINTHDDNTGGGDTGRLVTAETYSSGGETYMRIKSDVAGGTGEDNRVAISEDLAALDFSPPDKTLSYQIDGGDVISVSVSADTSISGLASLINDDYANPGVTASVIDDGSDSNPYKLSLISDTEGENGRIDFLSQLPDLTMNEQAGAGGASLNAQFSVDGISYQRSSNTIDDVISGVTVELQDTGISTVTVSGNNTQIKEYIQGLVEDYNTSVQDIKDKTAYDEENEELGPLARTTVRDLPHTMRNLMTSEFNADTEGEVTTMFDLGLNYNRDGTITLDESTLDEVMSNNPDSVQAFFLGDPDKDIEGLADKINDSLRVITGSSGQIAGEKTTAEDRIADLQASIEQETQRLDKKYERLTQEMINLSQYMDTMDSTSNFLTSQFDSISKAWVGSKD
ncbi:MAG: flagellar filament capping protein FliD [Thermodesulfobacteriota bacterium]